MGYGFQTDFMKHLHFTQSLEPLYGGGLGSSASALHQQMRARGVASVLYSTHKTTTRHQADTFEFRRLKPGPIYYSPDMHRLAAGLVKETDVLHGHGLYVGTNFIFGREARRQNKPLVYHVHGMFEPYILKRSRWKKNLVHWLFENANVSHVRLWRALTLKEADQIRAGGYQAPIVIAPNGLSLNNYQRPSQPLTSLDTPLVNNLTKIKRRILFVGRLHPKKGLDILLSAWAKLAQERKEWELVIAGPDEQSYLSQLQKLARSLGIEREIQFTGMVTGDIKVALFYSADLLVLPSYSEGLPMTLLEAMACQIPVIATHACNCPDIFSAGAGWGCNPTADSLHETLKAAMRSSDSERTQRGQLGRQLVERSYSWDQVTTTILEACAAYC
jgi:glycosyltransferase involved in cell wall biosynthesis